MSKSNWPGGRRGQGGRGREAGGWVGREERAQPRSAKLTSKSVGNGANFIPVQSSMMGWEVQLR